MKSLSNQYAKTVYFKNKKAIDNYFLKYSDLLQPSIEYIKMAKHDFKKDCFEVEILVQYSDIKDGQKTVYWKPEIFRFQSFTFE